MRFCVFILSGVLAVFWPAAHGQSATSPAAAELAELINRYRAENGLPRIPVSPSLNLVAQAHLADSERSMHPPGCNLHSWSNRGNWTPCCFTGRFTEAENQCMWRKPAEITGGRYRGDGFEISHGERGATGVTPASALAGWKGSGPHNDVILNRLGWKDMTWRAMGVAISGSIAHVWFGTEADADGAAASPARPPAPAQARVGFEPGDGYYRLQTRQMEPANQCLEGNQPGNAFLDGAAHPAECGRFTGQRWRFIPVTDGYYRLQTRLYERDGLCLEGGFGAAEGSPAGPQPCANEKGQLWKVVPVGGGYFKLQTMFLEGRNMCLEGGRPGANRSAADQRPCQNVSGQAWTFMPN